MANPVHIPWQGPISEQKAVHEDWLQSPHPPAPCLVHPAPHTAYTQEEVQEVPLHVDVLLVDG